MFTLLLTAAMARPHPTELAVPSIHNPAYPASAEDGASIPLAEAPGQPDMALPSDHPLIECAVRDERVVARMHATRDDYPATFPFTGSCTHRGKNLEVTVVPMAAAVDPSLQPAAFDEHLEVALTRPQGWLVARTYALPQSDDPYVPQEQVAATGVKHVSCEVFQRSTGPVVQLLLTPSATMGTATCELPLESGATQAVTFHLAEAPL